MEIPQRPHTVCSMPKMCVQSEYVLKLIQEIENEAIGPISKPKPLPKNHMKENLKRLRDIQARAKQKLAEKQPLQPLKVPNKYCDVQPKVSNSQSVPAITRQTQYSKPPKTAGPLRVCPPLSPHLSTKSDRSLHSCRSLPQLNQIDETDNVQALGTRSRNRIEPEKTSRSLAPMKKKSEIRHGLGEIPTYLTERKRQWEAERELQIKLMQEPIVPEGYTLLADEERIETLELLKKNQEELIQSLAALPVRNDTIRLRNYKEELERQLAKVEEGIKIFSRPKVLIKNDT